MRDREQRDTTSSNLSMSSYYAMMGGMGTISGHNRTETNFEHDEPAVKGGAKDVFWVKDHTSDLEGADNMTKTATWPTFSPATSKRVYADMDFFRLCDAEKVWNEISLCKQAVLFRPGDVCKTKNQYYLILGHVQWTMVLMWLVERESIGKTNNNAFTLDKPGGGNNEYTMFNAIDLSKFEMVPTTPLCPLHFPLACRNHNPERLGIVLLQLGPPLGVLKHAAKPCCFDLDRTQLLTICKQERIEHMIVRHWQPC